MPQVLAVEHHVGDATTTYSRLHGSFSSLSYTCHVMNDYDYNPDNYETAQGSLDSWREWPFLDEEGDTHWVAGDNIPIHWNY
jgi:uncharacterized protein YecE (DUF72 family)